MKYLPVFIVLIISFTLVSHQFARDTPQEDPEINIQIDGRSSQWVYLQAVHKNVKSKLDSTWLDPAGKGSFKYNIALDPGYYNLLISEEVSLPILLDQDQNFSIATHADHLIEDAVVEGNLETSLLYKSLQFDIDLQARFQAEAQGIMAQEDQQLAQNSINAARGRYFAEKADFLESLFRKYPNSLYTKYERAKQQSNSLNAILADRTISPMKKQEMVLSAYWDQFDFSDERLLRTPIAFDKLWEYFNQFVPDQTAVKIQALDILLNKVAAYPAYQSFFATWLADDYLPPFTGQMDPDAFYTHLVNKHLTKDQAPWADSLKIYAWNLRAESRGVSLIGMKGANFEAQTPDGNTQALYDIKTPYVALFFYHYDCDHCIETAPKLVQQYQALKDQGLEVVAVAMDTPEEEWKNFIQENQMNWINVTDQDNAEIYEHYNAWATPEIMLLDQERTIIGKHLAVEDLAVLMQANQMAKLPVEQASSSTKNESK